MGTAMCLGEAAGTYAALYALGEEQFVQRPYERIRRMLRAHGALVSVDDAFAAAHVDAGITSPESQLATT